MIVYCGCGDEIVSGDGARCGTCVAVKYKEREWQSLTDDEMLMIYAQPHEGFKYSLGRMVQAKLKEKNST